MGNKKNVSPERIFWNAGKLSREQNKFGRILLINKVNVFAFNSGNRSCNDLGQGWFQPENIELDYLN